MYGSNVTDSGYMGEDRPDVGVYMDGVLQKELAEPL